MRNVYVIATACTPFGKHAELSFQALTRQAYLELLADAGLDAAGARLIEQAWFGNCGMGQWGQGGIRGQVAFTPLVEEGLFPERVPMINVEGGCATASFAFHGAFKDILSGQAEVSLALGVEKLVSPDDPARTAGAKFASAASEHSSAAAAPSPSGEHIARVSGKLISRSASTSSTVSSKRYCAFGFRLP